MAEVVTTAVGVAASIVQLTEAVIKLRSIYASFKNASTDLTDLEHEIFIVAEQFDRSKDYFKNASLLNDKLVDRCVSYLQDALDAIQTVTREMQKARDRHKLIGAMKMVLGKDQIRDLEAKLVRAQRLMSLTEMDIERAQRNIANAKLEMILVELKEQKLARRLNQAPRQATFLMSTSSKALPATTLSRTTASRSIGYKGISRGHRYRIPVPAWLLSKAFEILYERESHKIDFGLRCYNIISARSDICTAIVRDDISRVNYLFENNWARPFDSPEDGRSLLNRAIFACSSRMCHFLVEKGAEIEYIDQQGTSILDVVVVAILAGPRNRDYKEFRRNIEEIIQLFIAPIDFDDQERQALEARLVKHPGLAPWTRLVLKGGISMAGLLTPEDRAKMIVGCRSLDMVEELLGQDLDPKQAFTYAKDSGFQPWDLLVHILYSSEEGFSRWIPIARQLVEFEQGLTADEFQRQSDPAPSIVAWCLCDCFLSVLNLRGDPWSRCAWSNQNLQKFLNRLHTLGANLALFGQLEQLTFHRHICRNRSDFPWKVTRLETGPHPTDWRLWMAPSGWEYEWAGQFWHRIENPELYIPGAFLADIPC